MLLESFVCTESSDVMIIDSVRFMKPSDFDVLLSDITETDLFLIAEMEGAPYLNISVQRPKFPVEGMLMGTNRRYMVNLLARRKHSRDFKNVVFMVDTGSPYTFLSKTAMAAMVGSNANIPPILKLEIQGDNAIVCHLSPPDKHFADVNLLGTDYLEMKGINLITDWPRRTFALHDIDSFKRETSQKCIT